MDEGDDEMVLVEDLCDGNTGIVMEGTKAFQSLSPDNHNHNRMTLLGT